MNDNDKVSMTMDGTPMGTVIKLGDQVLPCRRIEVVQEADRLPRMTVDLVSSGTDGQITIGARFRVMHPVDFDLRVVKRIEFADGTTWEAPPCNA